METETVKTTERFDITTLISTQCKGRPPRNVPFVSGQFKRRARSVGVWPAASRCHRHQRLSAAGAGGKSAPMIPKSSTSARIPSPFVSLNRPGGNVTGVSFLTYVAAPKRLGLLRDLIPSLNVLGLLTFASALRRKRKVL